MQTDIADLVVLWACEAAAQNLNGRNGSDDLNIRNTITALEKAQITHERAVDFRTLML